MQNVIIENNEYTNPVYNAKFGYFGISKDYVLKNLKKRAFSRDKDLLNLFSNAEKCVTNPNECSSLNYKEIYSQIFDFLDKGGISLKLFTVLMLAFSPIYRETKRYGNLLDINRTLIYRAIVQSLDVDDMTTIYTVIMIGLKLGDDLVRRCVNWYVYLQEFSTTLAKHYILYSRILDLLFRAFVNGVRPFRGIGGECPFKPSLCYFGVQCTSCRSYHFIVRAYNEYLKRATLFSFLKQKLDLFEAYKV